MKYKVGDLVGIGWNGALKRKYPAIVLRAEQQVGGAPFYVVRVLDDEARESWCDGTYITPWKTDKK